jgi:hypothetical protein
MILKIIDFIDNDERVEIINHYMEVNWWIKQKRSMNY